MLSDTLFDAVNEIERYQKDFPDVYAPYAREIEMVKHVMNSLRITLDTPPSPNVRSEADPHGCPECGEAHGYETIKTSVGITSTFGYCTYHRKWWGLDRSGVTSSYWGENELGSHQAAVIACVHNSYS